MKEVVQRSLSSLEGYLSIIKYLLKVYYVLNALRVILVIIISSGKCF